MVNLANPVAGDVGKLIKWDSGEEAVITAVVSGTVATVNRSQTVASGPLKLHHGNLFKLPGPINAGNSPTLFVADDGRNSNSIVYDYTTGIFNLRRTYDFAVETVARTYRSVAVSPINAFIGAAFAIVDFSATPVSVGVAKQLRVVYELNIVSDATTSAQISALRMTDSITGWPQVYNIASITSTVSTFTITTTTPHHFNATGTRKINVAGTVNYNGEFTITSVTSTTIVITSAINAGTETAVGTVYGNTKHTNRLVGSPCVQVGVGTPDGSVTSNGSSVVSPAKGEDSQWHPNVASSLWLYNGLTPTMPAVTVLQWGAGPSNGGLGDQYIAGSSANQGWLTTGWVDAANAFPSAIAAYTPGNFYRDHVFNITAGACVGNTVRAVMMASGSYLKTYWLFEEPQKKAATHSVYLTVRWSWGRVVSNA